ncbi:nucleotidyltransferase domain-containing protein [Phenylobacterium sp.]|uniref:nucleotidyltransferase domain-containing protein n=1 Tax=Phenylobacterium sp. TaxID=1871053 RepID=UPI0027350186|nr:hypothetical protein [Phenylobacterium sp.]MDP3635235.1 hypothetical protein [Phenylobacterium sp.]MDZ4051694.1 hypothetical protein [Phenylobacterium sp.]
MTPHWDGPPLEAWDAWTPEEAAARLAGVAAPWCVVGGWALDVWLGRESRVHEDLEIAVPKPFLPQMRAQMAGLDLYSVGDGEVLSLAPGAEPPEDKHQIWGAEGDAWRLDVMAEPGDAETWVFRRDESVTAPRAQMMGRSPTGVPYLKPEGALLYKAAKLRPKDEADFALFAPLLDAGAKAWLEAVVSRLYPGHRWLGRLAP